MSDKSIEQLVKDLEQAKSAHEAAAQRESYARLETTSALNALNQAQKALDARMQTLRKGAHRDTDWARNERQAHG